MTPRRTRETMRRDTNEMLRRISLEVNRHAGRVARRLGVPSTNVHAVGVLQAHPEGLSASQLSAELGLSASATSTLIDRLEASGHAARATASDDGRRACITATDTALAASRDGFVELNDAIARALSRHSVAEVRAFHAVLHSIHEETSRT